MNSHRTSAVRGAALSVAALFVLLSSWGRAQEASAAAPRAGANDASVRELEDQIRQLRSLIDALEVALRGACTNQ